MPKYFLEFILHIYNTPVETIRSSLIEFGDGLEVTDCQDNIARGKNFKVQIYTEDPEIIFDTCAQFGRIKSVKVEERGN